MGGMKAPEDLLRKIRQGNRFLLTSHINPDGDAIGSELGPGAPAAPHGQGGRGVEPRPHRRRSTGRCRAATACIPARSRPPASPTCSTRSSCWSARARTARGLEKHLGAKPIINIDHHLGNQHYGAINWVDSAAPAVGEMVYRLAQGLKLALEPETASCLYLTLVTDTGGFRFSNATPAAFEAAAALVRDGAQPEQVSQWLYESQPLAVVRLAGEMLQTLQVHEGGRIATARLTPEMFARVGAAPGDSEGLIDYPRSIAGVDAVALIRQREDGTHKVSLRSRGEVDVEKIARHHGGGGHRNAAGFALEGDGEAIRQRVVEALAGALAAPPAEPPAAAAAEEQAG